MKSRTSFFNLTVFRKNITRFAPVWALYTIYLLLVLFTIGFGRAELAYDLSQCIGPMTLLNFAYAGICAFFLFGDLFNSRLCNALHAFPMRREGWLLTNVASGVLFSVGPNLIVGLLGCAALGEYFYMSFIWQAASLLQFLFFFGTAVLSAVCAGNRLAIVAVYAIIHFITVLVYGVWNLLYQPLLYGVEIGTRSFYKFFPLYQLMECDYLEVMYTGATNTPGFFLVRMVSEGWVCLGLCALAGLVSFAFAWLVYRRRHLETAGDFISLRHLSPVFLTIYTIGAAMVLYMFAELFNGQSVLFLIVGLVVGYFTGRMLLGRTLRVFNKKSLIGFAVLVIAIAVSMGLTKLDPLGVSTYIPDTDDIQSVALYDIDQSHLYRRDDYDSFEFTDREEIVLAQDFHKQMQKYGDPGHDSVNDVHIRYTLKNGKQITRYYKVALDSELGARAKKYFSDLRYIFQVEDAQNLKDLIKAVMVEYTSGEYGIDQITSKDHEWIAGLLDALEKDSKAGALAQGWYSWDGKITSRYVEFQLYNEENWYNNFISIYKESTNTVAYLDDTLDSQKNK